jgi:hypothetical protein
MSSAPPRAASFNAKLSAAVGGVTGGSRTAMNGFVNSMNGFRIQVHTLYDKI